MEDRDIVLQKISVLVGSCVTGTQYCILRAAGVSLTDQDKFWCALPFFAAMIVTDRCFIAKLIRHFKQMRKL